MFFFSLLVPFFLAVLFSFSTRFRCFVPPSSFHRFRTHALFFFLCSSEVPAFCFFLRSTLPFSSPELISAAHHAPMPSPHDLVLSRNLVWGVVPVFLRVFPPAYLKAPCFARSNFSCLLSLLHSFAFSFFILPLSRHPFFLSPPLFGVGPRIKFLFQPPQPPPFLFYSIRFLYRFSFVVSLTVVQPRRVRPKARGGVAVCADATDESTLMESKIVDGSSGGTARGDTAPQRCSKDG